MPTPPFKRYGGIGYLPALKKWLTREEADELYPPRKETTMFAQTATRTIADELIARVLKRIAQEANPEIDPHGHALDIWKQEIVAALDRKRGKETKLAPNRKICGTCRFFSDQGTCQRYPPLRHGWPDTSFSGTCGEWKKKTR